MNFETLQKDMITAMKARDKERKETISILVSAVKKLAIDEGTRENIPDELVDRAIIKELKTAKEQVETCPADRTELREQYTIRVNIISEYAPKMLSEEDIKEIINTEFADIAATKNKGAIMKEVMAKLKGKADGKVISAVVADICK
ncbi:MAG: GatB/YqeY domain-containing protein [Clostridiales bacterium]|nr:GatB/YqeY domain-containing protein [Clostridiales bacterium]